jgi:hypothetical protein
MMKMRYIDQWLSGLGLEHIIPKLTEQGITTPKKLAQLSLRDMYEVVGIEDAEDRKKLFYLIQRLNTIFKKEQNSTEEPPAASAGEDDAGDEELSEQPAAPAAPAPAPAPAALSRANSAVRVSPLRARPASPPAAAAAASRALGASATSIDSAGSDDDLKVLRKQRKANTESSGNSALLQSSANGSFSEHDREHEPAAPPAARPGPDALLSVGARSGSFDRGRSSRSPRVPEPAEPRRAPSPIVPPEEREVGRGGAGGLARGSSSDILGRAEQASAGRLSVSYQPSAFPGAAPGPADVGIGSVTAKVLARRQQRDLAQQQQQEAAPPRHHHEHHPHHEHHQGHHEHHQGHHEHHAPRRLSSPEVSLEGRYRDQDRYRGAGAESPPPPAPPLSNSGSMEGQFAFEKQASAHTQSRHNSGHDHYPDHRGYGGKSNRPEPEPEPEFEDEDEFDDFDTEARGGGGGGHRLPTTAEVVDMSIRVVLRKRPISRSELAKGDNDVLDIEAGSVYVYEPKTKVDLTKVIETHVFQFDDAFNSDVTNEDIYNRTVKHLMGVLFDFGKASCFAYGQTGSGKTFTMMGSNPAAPASVRVNAGLYVLAARDIFARIKHPKYSNLLVFVSCFEIYGGKLFDLLNDRKIVKCLEDSKQQVQLPGLTEHGVDCVDSLLHLMSQAHSLRSIGSTGANLESSRSHQVLQIVIRRPEPAPEAGKARRMGGVVRVEAPKQQQYGKLSFIDLAGSERGADTTSNSKQTRLEGAEINTSLLALKEVIRSLNCKHGHTPFRGSKLTQVLKDSFVGDKTRTCMVACVSPSHANCEHTLNTLRYADRVKEHQLSSNNNPSAGDGEGRRSPPQQMENYDNYDAHPSKPQRPSTAVPAGEGSKCNSAGQARPSTAASRPSSRVSSAYDAAPDVGSGQPSSWELDRIRREAEGRRRPATAAEPQPEPVSYSARPQAPASNPTPGGANSRESKIPSSPSSRSRVKSIGGRQRAPSPAPSSPPRASPARGAPKPSPARTVSAHGCSSFVLYCIALLFYWYLLIFMFVVFWCYCVLFCSMERETRGRASRRPPTRSPACRRAPRPTAPCRPTSAGTWTGTGTGGGRPPRASGTPPRGPLPRPGCPVRPQRS